MASRTTNLGTNVEYVNTSKITVSNLGLKLEYVFPSNITVSTLGLMVEYTGTEIPVSNVYGPDLQTM
jgi:hypothetical protein